MWKVISMLAALISIGWSVRKENVMRNRPKAIALSAIPIVLFCSLVFAGEQTNERILVQDNSAFAMGLYQKLRTSDGNMFFSPYSISTALAMTYAGARGNTEKEMAKVLRFSLDQENLHSAFAQVESRLNKLQKTGNIKCLNLFFDDR